MTGTGSVAVVGARGFVGGAVVRALESQGVHVHKVQAPRLRCSATDVEGIRRAADVELEHGGPSLFAQMRGVDVVVNAAGDPGASSTDVSGLVGANALVPAVLLRSAMRCGVHRFVHVSSTAVQGDIGVLDESDSYRPFSAYSMSKALGEDSLVNIMNDSCRWPRLVIYRPSGVHSPDRRASQRIVSIARSPFSTVAGDGSRPTPQALIANVADAVAFLAVADDPPRYVLHPWEGLTAETLLILLGRGRRPLHLSPTVARGALHAGSLLGRLLPRLRADVRRAEMLWFGQRQARSWLEDAGWRPRVGEEGWRELSERV